MSYLPTDLDISKIEVPTGFKLGRFEVQILEVSSVETLRGKEYILVVRICDEDVCSRTFPVFASTTEEFKRKLLQEVKRFIVLKSSLSFNEFIQVVGGTVRT